MLTSIALDTSPIGLDERDVVADEARALAGRLELDDLTALAIVLARRGL